MVINKNSKGISYEAMVKNKTLNCFFCEESEGLEEEE